MKSRQIVCMFPVESIVGKLAREKDKVSAKNPGFKTFVGYQNAYAVTNRFQCKSKHRTTMASDSENSVRTKFKTAVTNTNTALTNPTTSAPYIAAYKKNPEGYNTLRGYVFAKEYAKIP